MKTIFLIFTICFAFLLSANTPPAHAAEKPSRVDSQQFTVVLVGDPAVGRSFLIEQFENAGVRSEFVIVSDRAEESQTIPDLQTAHFKALLAEKTIESLPVKKPDIALNRKFDFTPENYETIPFTNAFKGFGVERCARAKI